MFTQYIQNVRRDAMAAVAELEGGKCPAWATRRIDHLLVKCPEIIQRESRRADAQLLSFFARQLEYVFAEVEAEEFPELAAANGEILPIDTSVPEGARTFYYYVTSGAGIAEFMDAYTNGTAPEVTVTGARVTGEIKRIRNGYSWDIAELEEAQMAGMNLESDLAAQARRAHEERFNDTAFYGREDIGLPGLLTHPNITVSDAADNGSGSTLWVNKTPDQILADVNTLINTVNTVTFGVETVNTVLIARAQYLYVSTTRLGVGDGKDMILDLIKAAHPTVNFKICNECGTEFSTYDKRTGTSGSLDRLNNGQRNSMFAYTAGNARKAKLIKPKDFTQLPVQPENFRFKVPCESSMGGAVIKAPLSMHRMDGI